MSCMFCDGEPKKAVIYPKSTLTEEYIQITKAKFLAVDRKQETEIEQLKLEVKKWKQLAKNCQAKQVEELNRIA